MKISFAKTVGSLLNLVPKNLIFALVSGLASFVALNMNPGTVMFGKEVNFQIIGFLFLVVAVSLALAYIGEIILLAAGLIVICVVFFEWPLGNLLVAALLGLLGAYIRKH